MAMQAGMGISRILLLLGAGYTGAIALRNGWLADILEELQNPLDRGKTGSESFWDLRQRLLLSSIPFPKGSRSKEQEKDIFRHDCKFNCRSKNKKKKFRHYAESIADQRTRKKSGLIAVADHRVISGMDDCRSKKNSKRNQRI